MLDGLLQDILIKFIEFSMIKYKKYFNIILEAFVPVAFHNLLHGCTNLFRLWWWMIWYWSRSELSRKRKIIYVKFVVNFLFYFCFVYRVFTKQVHDKDLREENINFTWYKLDFFVMQCNFFTQIHWTRS